MRTVLTAPAIVVGSVLAPLTFVFSSGPVGPDAGLHDVEPRRIPSAFPFASDTPEPIAPRDSDAAPTAEPLTDDERDLVAWAYARFALVGLEVPPVDIAFHDDTEPCGGNQGRYRGSGERQEVAVCVPDWGTFGSHLHRQRTLVHELAHAWDHANLGPEDRVELLGILDASDWYAPQSDWDERGVERFAETIVWGLYDQLRRPVLIDVPCDELHADFHAITGFTAPGPLEVMCHPPSPESESIPTKGAWS